MIADFHGLVCPIVTPFDACDAIDLGATERLLDFLIARGVNAVFPGGTTGEGLSLSLEERETLCEAVVEKVAGRVPVIVHAGCITTNDTIRLARHARSAGAAAAAIIPPFFYTLDDESLFRHYTSVAASAPDFPIFLYAFPENAKNDISPGLLRRLRRSAPNIVGIKVSNPDLLLLQEYVRIGGSEFVVLNGVDGLMLAALSVGARGQVSGHSNVYPEPFLDLYAAFRAGDLEQASLHQQAIDRIRSVLADGLHPAYFKAALSLRGVPAGKVRAPMREITQQERASIETGLRQLGLPLDPSKPTQLDPRRRDASAGGSRLAGD